MRPWTFEIGNYPEHDCYEVEASRVLTNYALSVDGEYVHAEYRYKNCSDSLRDLQKSDVQDEANRVSQGAWYEALAEEIRKMNDCYDRVRRNPPQGTCLSLMGRHVRRYQEPGADDDADAASN
jgi:hypothetical protein